MKKEKIDRWELARIMKELFEENFEKTKSQGLAMQWTTYNIFDKYIKQEEK